MERNYHPDTLPYTEVGLRKRWAENSGLNYIDVSARFHRIDADYALLSSGGGSAMFISKNDLSYASWHLLRHSASGAILTVKVYARGFPQKWKP